jgi:GNAT superfamily N-acetyltransferase
MSADFGFLTQGSIDLVVRLKIRRLQSSDYTAVARIEKAVLEEYRQCLRRTGERDEVPSGIRPAYFDHYVRTKSSFVALVDGEVVGFILNQPVSFIDGEKKILWLDYIAVIPEFRRRGNGTLLLSSAEKWAKQHSCSILYTTLNPNNAESKRLLCSNGFTVKSWNKAAKRFSN